MNAEFGLEQFMKETSENATDVRTLKNTSLTSTNKVDCFARFRRNFFDSMASLSKNVNSFLKQSLN